MTLPQLWLADPSLWLIEIENKFRVHRITSEVRKHELLVEALPPQAMGEIRDILVGPPGDAPYTRVKHALLHRLVPPKHRRIQQLLCNEELEDRHPTQFSSHLQHLLEDQLGGLEISILRRGSQMCATLLMAHGKRPGRSSITAAGDEGQASSRLFHITDRTTGLRLLVDTGAEFGIIPAFKTDRRLREKSTPSQAINSSVILTD
ncbi:uncharacterized protein LOC142817602 [Rhipicephalus microplus]|uniref:uncharacterized protein LOC142817602 n=1 Tax=Rhipicephalus microplus TaxID=6941 RepID=UPI003F6ADDC3